MTFLNACRLFAAGILAAALPVSAQDTVALYGCGPALDDGFTTAWRSERYEVPRPEPVSTIAATSAAELLRFRPDRIIAPQAEDSMSSCAWKIVFLIYPSVDVEYSAKGTTHTFKYEMMQNEIDEATTAMASAIAAIPRGAGGEARARLTTTVIVGRTLPKLAPCCGTTTTFYWPDAQITAPELVQYARGHSDSVIVYWPAKNHTTKASVLNPHWGLSYGKPENYTYNVGYSTVSNIVSPLDRRYHPGEVFVHEWLHPVSDYYQVKGFSVPNVDHSTSYCQCVIRCDPYLHIGGKGLMAFYQDLMTGTTREPTSPQCIGLTQNAWCSGTPSTDP